VVHNLGGSRNFTLSPEFAVTLPAFGNTPTDIANQLAYGERQGVDSARPGLEGRLVAQFQLDHAKGVAPAQIIFSGMNRQRKEVVIAANVPTTALVNFKASFPTGAELTSNSYGGSVQAQLPTRWFTFLASYYSGEDLRWYFADQVFSTFNDFNGFAPGTLTAATAVDGSTVFFGTNAAGSNVLVPQRPVRAEGGFLNLGIPLSRIAHAEASGRNAGWTMYFHWGLDNSYARDARRAAQATPTAANPTPTGAGVRWRSDLEAVNLQWKINKFATFGYEVSRYSTRSVTGLNGGTTFPLAIGVPQHEFHDIRSEFATIFTF
jgi:hypothetical protein